LQFFLISNSFANNYSVFNHKKITHFSKSKNFHKVKKTKRHKLRRKFLKLKTIEQEEDFMDFEGYASNSPKINDPFENFNRKTHKFNQLVDKTAFVPIIKLYQQVPQFARSKVRNILKNSATPISTFNSFLQGKFENGLASLSSLLINSTIGIFGINSLAQSRGINYQDEDFGQTLSYYGVSTGPFLVLPFLGPSSGVDFAGLLIEKSLNPLDLNLLKIGSNDQLLNGSIRATINVVGAIDKRESLDSVLKSVQEESFDSYATIRSAYLQKRAFDSAN